MKNKKGNINSLRSINEIGAKLGLRKKDLEPIGNYSAKLSFASLNKFKDRTHSKLIVVVSTSPILNSMNSHFLVCNKLIQSLSLLKKKVILCTPIITLEDILLKGSYFDIFPKEELPINLLDMNNIAYIHNFISSYLNNQIVFNANSYNILWNRTYNLIDETLKKVITGVDSDNPNILIREEKVCHILNSELTSVVSLSNSVEDMKERVGKIRVAETKDGKPVTIKDLQIQNIVGLLLSSSLKPTLIQTKDGGSVFLYISGDGSVLPSGNVLTIKTALNLAEFVILRLNGDVHLGMEKFLNITCRKSDIKPDMVIITTFVNELNYYGGISNEKRFEKNLVYLEKGLEYLIKDIEIIKKFGIPVLVNVNEYRDISKDEMRIIDKHCSNLGIRVIFSNVSSGESNLEFVKNILETVKMQKSYFRPLYDLGLDLKEKIKIIAKEIYGKGNVNFSLKAEKQIEYLEKSGYGNLTVSITGDPYFNKYNQNMELNVKDLVLYVGAEIVVVISDNNEFMPNFPKVYNLNEIKNDIF